MDYDTYYRLVDQLADAVLADGAGKGAAGLLSTPSACPFDIGPAVRFREENLTRSEEDALSAYLEIGFLMNYTGRQRIAAWALEREVQYAHDVKHARRLCEPYSSMQPLFCGASGLLDRIRIKACGEPDYELINSKAVSRDLGSRICRAPSGFAKLDPQLNPGLLDWAAQEYGNSPLYLRLDPYSYHVDKPADLLMEAAVIPANPHWLSRFELFPGLKEYAEYVLEDCGVRENSTQFWEYQSKGLRRLEVYAKRRGDDYLSMMIEELPSPDAANGLMMTRMIHLDTLAPNLAPLDQVKLQHLDVAVNYYQADARKSRFSQRLREGRVQDATMRRHLMRIEDVPFVSLFDFAEMFFKSEILFTEWRDEVFPES